MIMGYFLVSICNPLLVPVFPHHVEERIAITIKIADVRLSSFSFSPRRFKKRIWPARRYWPPPHVPHTTLNFIRKNPWPNFPNNIRDEVEDKKKLQFKLNNPSSVFFRLAWPGPGSSSSRSSVLVAVVVAVRFAALYHYTVLLIQRGLHARSSPPICACGGPNNQRGDGRVDLVFSKKPVHVRNDSSKSSKPRGRSLARSLTKE